MLKHALLALAATSLAMPAAAEPITSPQARERTVKSVLDGRRVCRTCDLFQGAFSWHDLSGRDFTGARLRQADMEAVEADGANFARANLSIVNGFGARFSRANFTGANLSDGNFVGAYFGGATMRGANLERAILSGADLSGARGLTQTQISKACGDNTTLLPAGMTIPAC
jgi:uncharacterized protein YjbI with pentapeptide repeats